QADPPDGQSGQGTGVAGHRGPDDVAGLFRCVPWGDRVGGHAMSFHRGAVTYTYRQPLGEGGGEWLRYNHGGGLDPTGEGPSPSPRSEPLSASTLTAPVMHLSRPEG